MPKLSDRLAAARAAMTSDRAYRGTGVSGPRGPSKDQQRLKRRTGRRVGPAGGPVPTRAQIGKNRFAARPHVGGGIWDTVKAQGSKFVPPIARMMEGIGDLTSGALRGSRLHKAYKDEYGDSRQWEKDKRLMMTAADKAYYDKYMNLADMAQDNEKKQYYLDQAETAWRNKQTSDRLAAYTNFDDYLPSKYTGTGEGSRYTGGHHDRGKYVPGVEIMGNIMERLGGQGPGTTTGQTIGAVGGPIPEIDITEDLYGMYPGPEDDVLWGEPDGKIRPKPKPDSWRNVPEHGIHGRPDLSPPDPFGGMYESPLTDRLYGEPTNIGLASERALENRGYDISEDLFEGPWGDASSVALGKRGFANPGGTGYKGPVPNITVEFDDEVITPDYGNLDYFNQFIGSNFANPGGIANITEEEEQINPLWNQKAYKVRGYGG